MKQILNELLIFSAVALLLAPIYAQSEEATPTTVEEVPDGPKMIDKSCIERSYETAGKWSGNTPFSNED